jgi:predicted DCC family thiol-disulfide oxidoreductase YuxK
MSSDLGQTPRPESTGDTAEEHRPLVIFDGRCGFCRIWVEYWRELTAGRFRWAPSQEVGAGYPQIPPEEFAKSVQLVLPDGTVESGARAALHIAGSAPGWSWVPWCYENVPVVGPLAEAGYRFIAAHRGFAYQATRLLWGTDVRPPTFDLAENVFRRLLAIIYLIAFWSFAVQARGLIGSHGILPLANYLTAAHRALGASAIWRLPTLLWFNSSDAAIQWLPVAGIVAAAIAAAGFFQRTAFALLFLLYLSVCTAGQDFLAFQWDFLLLEAGLLAIFSGTSRVVLFLYRLLLFKLMFFSGMVKLLSGDVAWRNLSALAFHYHTQPLPTPVAWYMDQLPLWFQRASTAAVLLGELVVPFGIFLPRRPRFLAAGCLIGLQFLILVTGNYAFFNLLAIALCLLLFDDRALRRLWPRALRLRPRARVPRPLIAVLAALVLLLDAGYLCTLLTGSAPGPLNSLIEDTLPLGIVNTYGLFAVMTTTRDEIVVQGSNDGATWKDYSFRYKPGDLGRAPPWVAPHQPRLDWQMWFAALGDWRGSPWFVNFMVRLLQGSPDVTHLLAGTPFGDNPPRYVRALLYEYSFTDAATRRRTGDWWKREPGGLYFPPISLEDVRTP